ncbi:hypothetical protein [Microbacterium sp.]|uniref:DUF3846 domain-containing protein n=1 Tax=Microbacterium sp. TaxID=51671 RepID=UPI0031FF0CF6|nr:DUF3846 domain-containing protein [Microbacterium sp.]
MLAHLIDPESRTITSVEIPDTGDKLPDIYKHLRCDTFDVARLANGDGLYVDDEGLLKPAYHFIALRGMPQPYAGRGLVLGMDANGRSVAPTTSLEQLTRDVKFIELLYTNVVVVRDAANPSNERILPLGHVLKTLAEEAAE